MMDNMHTINKEQFIDRLKLLGISKTDIMLLNTLLISDFVYDSVNTDVFNHDSSGKSDISLFWILKQYEMLEKDGKLDSLIRELLTEDCYERYKIKKHIVYNGKNIGSKLVFNDIIKAVKKEYSMVTVYLDIDNDVRKQLAHSINTHIRDLGNVIEYIQHFVDSECRKVDIEIHDRIINMNKVTVKTKVEPNEFDDYTVRKLKLYRKQSEEPVVYKKCNLSYITLRKEILEKEKRILAGVELTINNGRILTTLKL